MAAWRTVHRQVVLANAARWECHLPWRRSNVNVFSGGDDFRCVVNFVSLNVIPIVEGARKLVQELFKLVCSL